MRARRTTADGRRPEPLQDDASQATHPRGSPFAQLQRQAGNRAVAGLLSGTADAGAPAHATTPGGGRLSPVVQRDPTGGLATAVAWATIGSAGFQVAQGAVAGSAGDLTWNFDEMEGTNLLNGDDAYKTLHQYPITDGEKEIAVWAGTRGSRKLGVKFGLNYEHDGYSIGSVSVRLLDTYDWPMWGGSVGVQLTPVRRTVDGAAGLRVTVNVFADRTIASSRSGSEVFLLTGKDRLHHLRGSVPTFQQWTP